MTVGVGLLLGTFGSLRPVRAEDTEATRLRSFREHYDRAGRAYNAKEYAAAIPELQAAYAIQPVPQLLFNIAQAYRRLDQFGPARAYFELYRSMSGRLKPEDAEALGRYIKEMEAREQAARTPQIVEKTRLLYVQSEKPPPRWLRPFGITTGIAGIAALSTGAVFLGLDGRCLSPAQPPALQCDQVYVTKTPGTALAAVGAGAIVLGAVTFGRSLRKPSRPAVREADTLDATDTMPALQPLPTAPAPDEPPPAGWSPAGLRQRAKTST